MCLQKLRYDDFPWHGDHTLSWPWWKDAVSLGKKKNPFFSLQELSPFLLVKYSLIESRASLRANVLSFGESSENICELHTWISRGIVVFCFCYVCPHDLELG